jgi:hypothetical protein
MGELMGELEFPSQSSDLIFATVVLIENLQRHGVIRVGRPMRPVHDGVTTASEYRVDDVTREIVADLKHVSQPMPGVRPTFLTA